MLLNPNYRRNGTDGDKTTLGTHITTSTQTPDTQRPHLSNGASAASTPTPSPSAPSPPLSPPREVGRARLYRTIARTVCLPPPLPLTHRGSVTLSPEHNPRLPAAATERECQGNRHPRTKTTQKAQKIGTMSVNIFILSSIYKYIYLLYIFI